MALSDIEKKKVEQSLSRFCDARIPPHVRDQIKLTYEFRGNKATLFENRPVWNDPTAKWTHMKIAQFRFDDKKLKWSLFCSDRNGKWHEYQNISTTSNFDYLISGVNEDPTGIEGVPFFNYHHAAPTRLWVL